MADDKDEVDNHDPHFEPIVNLPQVEIKTLEEDEEQLVKLRARLYRFDRSVEPPEWKERGTGDVKILRHPKSKACRILMRRDKTLKICANHHILSSIDLKKHCQSEKAFVWSTLADFADEEAKEELLAIRFGNAENAQKFKAAFDEAQQQNNSTEDSRPKEDTKEKEVDADNVAEKLEELSVKDKDAEKSESKVKTADSSDKDQAER